MKLPTAVDELSRRLGLRTTIKILRPYAAFGEDGGGSARTPKKRAASDNEAIASLSSSLKKSATLGNDDSKDYPGVAISAATTASATASTTTSTAAVDEDDDYFEGTSVASAQSNDDDDWDTPLDSSSSSSVRHKFDDPDGCIYADDVVQVTFNEEYRKGIRRHNTRRAETISRVLKHFHDHVGKYLLDCNLVYLPFSQLEKEWNIKTLPELKKAKHAVIYFRPKTKKFGRTVNGPKRLLKYQVDDDEIFYVVFDYDLAPASVMKKLENALPGLEELDGVHIDSDVTELTYDDVKKMDEEGLPIYMRLLYNSIIRGDDLKKGNGKAGSFGGANDIAGINRSIHLNNIESWIQNIAPDLNRGEFDQNSVAHEHMDCDFFKYQYDGTLASEKRTDMFYKACKPNEAEYLKEHVNEILAMLSWKRGNEKNLDSAKVGIHFHILNIDREEGKVGVDASRGRVVDSIPFPPPKVNGRNGVYNSEDYTDKDKEMGATNLEKFVSEVENGEGVRTLDTNKLVMSYLETDITTWLGRRGWRRFFVSGDLQVFRYKKADGKVRLLFVHAPLCYLLFSGTYSAKDRQGKTVKRDMNWNDVKSQAKRAETAQLLFNIFQRARESSDTTTSPEDRVANTLFFGSILSAFVCAYF
jgi:hypothetical protein